MRKLRLYRGSTDFMRVYTDLQDLFKNEASYSTITDYPNGEEFVTNHFNRRDVIKIIKCEEDSDLYGTYVFFSINDEDQLIVESLHFDELMHFEEEDSNFKENMLLVLLRAI